ncbi:MAG TPA: ATP-binding protein, partial [Pirellulales bacterium]|nr:ATP-binding protein [Pirellulales bacterium]
GDAAELLGPTFRHSEVELECRVAAERLIVAGDQKALEQVAWNLLFNALEAVQNVAGLRSVVVELSRGVSNQARLVVEDSGPGPSEAIGRQLFEPFATDKPSGTGLGLAVVKTIVSEHHGTLAWDRLDRSTRFTVDLPLIEVREEHGALAPCR